MLLVYRLSHRPAIRVMPVRLVPAIGIGVNSVHRTRKLNLVHTNRLSGPLRTKETIASIANSKTCFYVGIEENRKTPGVFADSRGTFEDMLQLWPYSVGKMKLYNNAKGDDCELRAD